MKKITVPFFISHQGCPHTCVFCDQTAISGSSGNLPDEQLILDKISKWKSTSGGRPIEIAFFGGTFTALPKSVQQNLLMPLQPLLNSGAITSIRLSTRPDYITDEIVLWLKHYGVTTIELGVQSLDDDVLLQSGRGHSADKSLTALQCIKRQGLVAGAQLMPGLPGDTLTRSMLSVRTVIAAGADFLRLYPAVVLKGTGMARLYNSGQYQPLEVSTGVNWCKMMLHEALVAGVPVIRIGLQQDDGLNSDSVLAGCWHPAMGQLVRSALYFDLVLKLLHKMPSDVPYEIWCHPSRTSDIAGHKNNNAQRLAATISGVFSDKAILKHEVILKNIQCSIKGNIITDLNYTQ